MHAGAKIPSPSSPWWFSVFALILIPLFSYGGSLTLQETNPRGERRRTPLRALPRSVRNTLQGIGHAVVKKMSATHPRPEKKLKSLEDAFQSYVEFPRRFQVTTISLAPNRRITFLLDNTSGYTALSSESTTTCLQKFQTYPAPSLTPLPYTPSSQIINT